MKTLLLLAAFCRADVPFMPRTPQPKPTADPEAIQLGLALAAVGVFVAYLARRRR